MNILYKKMLLFLLVIFLVAVAGWYGRKAYKNATERRDVTEATRYLDKKDVRSAALCLQRALQINPMSVSASKIMADMLESANAPAALRKNACREIPRPGFAGTVMSELLAHLVAELGVPLAVSRND